MITKRQKNRIKKVLGNDYCNPISEYLFSKGIRNRLGHPYSNASITVVMNGRENPILEKAIFDLLELRILDNEVEEAKRKSLLKAV